MRTSFLQVPRSTTSAGAPQSKSWHEDPQGGPGYALVASQGLSPLCVLFLLYLGVAVDVTHPHPRSGVVQGPSSTQGRVSYYSPILGQPRALSSVSLIFTATRAQLAQMGQCPRAGIASALCFLSSLGLHVLQDIGQILHDLVSSWLLLRCFHALSSIWSCFY